MKILPNCVFAKRDPIIIGVKIEDGQLRQGAPVCVAEKVMGAENKGFPFFPKRKISRVGRKLEGCANLTLRQILRHFGGESDKKVFVIYTFLIFKNGSRKPK